MARLDRSLGELRIANPLTHGQWHAIAMHLIEASPRSERAAVQAIYIQVTRGVAPREHAMVQGLVPTVFVMLNPMKPVSDAMRAKGVSCVSAHDFRWQKAHIKSTSLLGAVLARQISVEAGAAETIMFRGDWLSEASSSNVWVVKDGAVYGPPKDELVLTGIRYGLIERICAEAGIPFSLRRIARDEVFGARRAAAVLGQQGGAAGGHARRPDHWQRPSRPGLPGAACGLPEGHRAQRARARSHCMSTSPDTPSDARKESLIENPSQFPIKVMGVKAEQYGPTRYTVKKKKKKKTHCQLLRATVSICTGF